jgi:hypothetical protein
MLRTMSDELYSTPGSLSGELLVLDAADVLKVMDQNPQVEAALRDAAAARQAVLWETERKGKAEYLGRRQAR